MAERSPCLPACSVHLNLQSSETFQSLWFESCINKRDARSPNKHTRTSGVATELCKCNAHVKPAMRCGCDVGFKADTTRAVIGSQARWNRFPVPCNDTSGGHEVPQFMAWDKPQFPGTRSDWFKSSCKAGCACIFRSSPVNDVHGNSAKDDHTCYRELQYAVHLRFNYGCNEDFIDG